MTSKAMTIEEAEQVLVQCGEIEAEAGSSFVFGGGRAEDASAFVSQWLSEDHRRARDEAQAVLDAHWEAVRQEHRRAMAFRQALCLTADAVLGQAVYDRFRDADPADDIPF